MWAVPFPQVRGVQVLHEASAKTGLRKESL
jgi:hypothetical protein